MSSRVVKWFIVAAIGAVASLIAPAAMASKNLSCNNYSPLETMFKDVCWDGMFPMRISGATFISGDSGIPSDAAKKVICTCDGNIKKGKLPKVGVTAGLWMPAKIIDVTRKPYCYPSLNGIELPLTSVDALTGGANRGRNDRKEAFANWAMYAAPLVYMLRLLDEGACPTDGLTEFDIMHGSPLFPTHNDVTGRYTLFLNPEMALFANPVAMLAMPFDAIASSMGKPVNALFWVAGSWGAMYPMTGFDGTGKMKDPVGFTSLIATRSLALLHRLGFLSETIGNDTLCERPLRFILRKDAFRWQFLAPSPESSGKAPTTGGTAPAAGTENQQVKEVNPPTKNGTCTHTTGATTATWGMWRDVPATGEDHSYLLFQWTDCCFGFTL